MSNTPTAYTKEEVRDMLIDHIRATAAYWADLPDIDKATGKTKTVKDRCDGVAFSILSMLDGCSGEIPAIILKVDPHKDDKEFNISEGEKWFEPGMELDFMMHEYFYARSD